jgi:hypothetical protein
LLQGSLLSVSHFRLSYHNEYGHHMVSWTNRLHCHVLVLPYVLCCNCMFLKLLTTVRVVPLGF